jgi:glutamine amidotransferase-like uncharacterized protein
MKNPLVTAFAIFGAFMVIGSMNSRAGALTESKRDALVYRGPGSCDEGCSEAAALMAEMAGFNPVYVGPNEMHPKLFDNAAIWIQPGGKSTAVGHAMSESLKNRIRAFVHDGGAYVGFCAGGFYATEKIGTTNDRGLGLIVGRSRLYKKVKGQAAVLDLSWGGSRRSIYWEGGPAFYPPPSGAGVDITATYPDGTAASIRGIYGTGRVYVTGMHPEAPQSWFDYFHLKDGDGLDHELAVDMIQWATQ